MLCRGNCLELRLKLVSSSVLQIFFYNCGSVHSATAQRYLKPKANFLVVCAQSYVVLASRLAAETLQAVPLAI